MYSKVQVKLHRNIMDELGLASFLPNILSHFDGIKSKKSCVEKPSFTLTQHQNRRAQPPNICQSLIFVDPLIN